MYKLHSLQHPDWLRTGTSYCYFYIFEIIHHDIVFFIFVFLKNKKSCKHPTPMAIQLHPQCLLGIQSILRNWTFLIFKQV